MELAIKDSKSKVEQLQNALRDLAPIPEAWPLGGYLSVPSEHADVLETWEMYGCFIQSANYNQVAYNSSEPVNITLTLRFDNALQKPDGVGVGSVVPRLNGVTATG